MSDCCSGACASTKPVVDPRYRRILWIALVVNALMFGVELAGGLASDSVALLADAVDFLGDAGNYALSLLVLGSALLPSVCLGYVVAPAISKYIDTRVLRIIILVISSVSAVALLFR